MKLAFVVLRDLSWSVSTFQNIKMNNERQNWESKFYLLWFIIPKSEKLWDVVIAQQSLLTVVGLLPWFPVHCFHSQYEGFIFMCHLPVCQRLCFILSLLYSGLFKETTKTEENKESLLWKELAFYNYVTFYIYF